MTGRVGDVERVIPVTQALCPGTVNGRDEPGSAVDTTDDTAEFAASSIRPIGHVNIDNRGVLIPGNEFNSTNIPKTRIGKRAAVA